MTWCIAARSLTVLTGSSENHPLLVAKSISVAELVKMGQAICGLGKLLIAKHLEGSTANNVSKGMVELVCSAMLSGTSHRGI